MSVVDAKPFAISSIPFALSPSLTRHCEERSDEAIHSFLLLRYGLLRFARNDELGMFVLLLLLLLLLPACVQHPPFRQRDRLIQHVDVADVIGKDQHQRRIPIGARFVAQAAMRLDTRAPGRRRALVASGV